MERASHVPVVAMGVVYAVIGAGGAWWMHAADVRPWPEDGLAPGPLATAVGLGVVIGVALHGAYRLLHGRPSVRPMEAAVREAVESVGLGNLFALLPGAVLAEEVLFRGAMHPTWGWLPASVAFGLAHWLPPKRAMWLYPVVSAVAGAAFSAAYWLAGDHLLAPFAAHLTVNALNLGLLREPEPVPDPDDENGV